MESFDEIFDFVVVGSGGGSMCAALVMREAGKSVAILEKTALAGGTTARSGGAMWIPNNRYMKRDGVADSPERAMSYLDNLLGDDPTARGATRARRLTYVTEAPRMIDFLAEQGIRLTRTNNWPDYYDTVPGGSSSSRSLFSEVFNLRELGSWKQKLRPSFIEIPANLGELFDLPYYKKNWKARLMILRIGVQLVLGKILGREYVAGGAGLQGQMLKAALKAGVEIRLEAPVNEIIAENGRAVGVVTVKNGKPWRVGGTLGILVNAGGFARNQDMRDRYQPGTRVEWSSAAEGDTGEMIREMVRLGAAISQMDERVGNQTSPVPGFDKMLIKPAMQSVTANPHCILVDQTGVRYMTEGGSYSAYCKGMLERNKSVPAVPSWAICDERVLTDYMFAGAFPGLKKTKAWIEAGYLKKADSIEGLARCVKIDPAVLRATIDRFNGFVDKGVDEDFHRGESAYDAWLGDRYHTPSPSLGKIEQGPFYAVEVLPGDMGTYGGVVTDAHGRVLRDDGSVIEGLYATGVSTASVMGRHYPGGGSSVGPSFTWGFISAKHAANVGNSFA